MVRRLSGRDISPEWALALKVENLKTYHLSPCDVALREQVDAAFQNVLDRWGRIDILDNNACFAVFIIGPGKVRTIGVQAGVCQPVAFYGMREEEFLRLHRGADTHRRGGWSRVLDSGGFAG